MPVANGLCVRRLGSSAPVTETCEAASRLPAGTALTCDDADVCNGAESCDAVSGCEAGTPLTCDDADVCNGLETCDAVARLPGRHGAGGG